jgi:hypothetical protein
MAHGSAAVVRLIRPALTGAGRRGRLRITLRASAPARTQLVAVRPHPLFEVAMMTSRSRHPPAAARAFADMVGHDLARGHHIMLTSN